MKVLVGCEVSGTVRDAFRALGHDAFSCDLQSSESPFHIQGDLMDIINQGWDLLILHPPCTFLSVVGNAHLKKPGRSEERNKAFEFFMACINAECARICVENPVGFPCTAYRHADQIINPFDFGDSERKRTALWLKGLPPLNATHFPGENLIGAPECLPPNPKYVSKNGKKHYFTESVSPSKDRQNIRSKTFQGIANAMAQQWGNLK